MRYTSRYADHISRRKFPPDAALNSAIAFLVRRDSLSMQIGPAHYQRGRAGLYKKDVDLRFVPLHLSIGFPVNE